MKIRGEQEVKRSYCLGLMEGYEEALVDVLDYLTGPGQEPDVANRMISELKLDIPYDGEYPDIEKWLDERR